MDYFWRADGCSWNEIQRGRGRKSGDTVSSEPLQKSLLPPPPVCFVVIFHFLSFSSSRPFCLCTPAPHLVSIRGVSPVVGSSAMLPALQASASFFMWYSICNEFFWNRLRAPACYHYSLHFYVSIRPCHGLDFCHLSYPVLFW